MLGNNNNIKSETIKLMNKRSDFETEMDSIIYRLSVPGGPGITTNLTDSDGFPRSDIDIPGVLAERHRLTVLRKDYKDITDKIDQNIQLLHSARLPSKSSPPKDSGSKSEESSSISVDTSANAHGAGAMDVDLMVTVPFALVDEISEASPAAEDGIQLGDQIVKFGSVEAGVNLLSKLASEAQANQNCGVPVVVLRQGARVHLTVKPRTWLGRGLLGYETSCLSSMSLSNSVMLQLLVYVGGDNLVNRPPGTKTPPCSFWLKENTRSC